MEQSGHDPADESGERAEPDGAELVTGTDQFRTTSSGGIGRPVRDPEADTEHHIVRGLE